MVLLQITQDGGLSASWGFLVLAGLANVLLYRLLNRIEKKIEEHDNKLNSLDLVVSNHELRIASQEKFTDNLSKDHSDLANQIIAKIKLLNHL